MHRAARVWGPSRALSGARAAFVEHVLDYESNDTLTIPAGVTSLFVQLWSGGGGGGNGVGGGGGGGGGGGYGEVTHVVAAGQEIVVNVYPGGQESVGAIDCLVQGPTWTLYAVGGGAGGDGWGAGGAGGTCFDGDVAHDGGAGATSADGVGGGGGGGGGGTTANGAAGAAGVGGAGGSAEGGLGGDGATALKVSVGGAQWGGGGGGGAVAGNTSGSGGGPGHARLTYWGPP